MHSRPADFDNISACHIVKHHTSKKTGNQVPGGSGLIQKKKALMVGILSDKVVYTPTEEVLRRKKKIDIEGYKLAQILAS